MSDPQYLKYIINHVFMPPKLPQASDDSAENDAALCTTAFSCAQEYVAYLPEEKQPSWNRIIRMLSCIRELYATHDGVSFGAKTLQHLLRTMMPGDTFAALIRAQNAGIIFRKLEDDVIFECFEASALNEKVLETEGKLRCSYPGPAVSLPGAFFEDDDFLKEIASFLSQMNVDVFQNALPHSKKAGVSVAEDRNTADPKHITQLLTGILRGLGSGEPAQVPRVCKRIADDVLWSNARLPWRRSPLWLVIRVALQTTFMREDPSHQEYKKFMAFIHSQILRHAVLFPDVFDNESLFCIRAKLCQRSQKLDEAIADSSLWKEIQESCGVATKLMEARWKSVQEAHAQTSHWDPSGLRIEDDTRLTLTNSKEYILRALANEHSDIPKKDFHPDDGARLRHFTDLPQYTSGDLNNVFQRDSFLVLLDFERSIVCDLGTWTKDQLSSDDATGVLLRCITEYHAAADRLYRSSPEDMSMMFLTLFELWMALDRIAMAHIPLMLDYPPQMSSALLESLLLRKARDLARLRVLQDYLKFRNARATHSSVFSDPSPSSFAVHYFDQSASLQAVKESIETDAAAQQRKKREELHQKTTEYEKLLTQRGTCDDQQIKKRLNKRMKKLSVDVYEWPLPKDDSLTKTVVFELQCPVPFSHWREATFFLLNDVCSHSPTSGAKPYQVLSSYKALLGWTKHTSRITLASTTKPFTITHYSKKKLPTDDSAICVPNGLTWRLYDKISDRWVDGSCRKMDISAQCTFRLPADIRYQNLQYTIDSTSRTSNEVLSRQFECSSGISLHEYVSFAHLRSGGRMQWMNIMHSFVERTLSFNREAVHVLFLQTALQVGQFLPDDSLEWHQDLLEVRFGLTLLEYMEKLIDKVLGNWREVFTVKTVILLTTRLLAANPSASVVAKSIQLLRCVRCGTHNWIRALQEKWQNHDESRDRLRLSRRILDIAATCRATYDVDDCHLPSLLSSANDVMIFVECAILLRDNEFGGKAEDSIVYYRDRRLAHSILETLCSNIGSKGLNNAIKTVWTTFDPSSKGWTRLNEYWITCNTKSKRGTRSQVVHLNVLQGTLLIDGSPLSRLPSEICDHFIYRQFLEDRILEVVPSDVLGMEFMTRKEVHGYQLFFARRGSGVVIRARSQLSQPDSFWELLPRSIFAGDLPTPFVEDYTHWLHLDERRVELRQNDSLWERSHNLWNIDMLSYQMHRDSARSLDINSDTFKMISARLAPLENPQFMYMVYSGLDGLRVHLPRFKLSFSLDGWDLLSDNMENMIVDSNNSSGTMTGLRRQLVLVERHSGSSYDLPTNRCVLIPFGQLEFRKEKGHVWVDINIPQEQRHIRYFTYSINVDLQRLDGSGTLESTLYRAYLHALTSSCLPDPLTHKTGTVEALSLLYSAACVSFQRLQDREKDLLLAIAQLTPRREYYPPHLKDMQTVHWSPLPALSQSEGFERRVKQILTHAQHLSIFEDCGQDCSEIMQPLSPLHLLERASARKQLFYPPDSNWFAPIRDSEYCSRDTDLAGEEVVQVVSKAIMFQLNVNPRSLIDNPSIPPLLTVFEQWGTVANTRSSFSYDRTLVEEEPSSIILPLFNHIVHRNTSKVSSALLFSICALAYRKHNRHLIPYLVAFTIHPEFWSVAIPPWSSYDLSCGRTVTAQEVSSYLETDVRQLKRTPSHKLQQLTGETSAEFQLRRKTDYESRCQQSLQSIVAQLVKQWPCESPSIPPSTDYHDVSTRSKAIRNLFLSRFSNDVLHEYLTSIERIFQSVCSRAVKQHSIPIMWFTPCFVSKIHSSEAITLSRIMQHRQVPSLGPTPIHFPEVPNETTRNHEQSNRLRTMLDGLNSGDRPSRLQKSYLSLLHSSHESLLKSSGLDNAPFLTSSTIDNLLPSLNAYHEACGVRLKETFQILRDALRPRTVAEISLDMSDRWPETSCRSLMETLSLSRRSGVPQIWKEALTVAATAVVRYQQARRLLRFGIERRHSELLKELQNSYVNVQGLQEFPDWLLIQIENDFLVRPVQIQIAEEMITPSNDGNSLLQLNMGEGKSSVIIPFAATSLADTTRLVRVIVLKSLAAQMFQLLVQRLTGLVNRRIFYLPFSRRVKIDDASVQLIRRLYESCKDDGGILVSQPEHSLSLMLMSMDMVISVPTNKLARDVLELERFIRNDSRDLVDESDEIFHPRYALIYTLGQQQALQGHPYRWRITMRLFSLVLRHAPALKSDFEDHVDLRDRGQEVFPHLSILPGGHVAGAALVNRVADDVMDGRMPEVHFRSLSSHAKELLKIFISVREVDPRTIMELRDTFRYDGTWYNILHLRGMLACGVLVYALTNRRWRVDFGLDLQRSLLAVPFRAKDVPSLRSEFSHPDLAITLTCLSYYYEGLRINDLSLCLDALFQLDNPQLEYEAWIRNVDILPSLRDVQGINLDDGDQIHDILWPMFRWNRRVINFYLDHFVFPKAAKDFPHKLPSSGWDLAERRRHPMTGFSGTNDNHYLIPTSVDQIDQEEQRATNALVLSYLLHPDNKYGLCFQSSRSSESLLQQVVDERPAIRAFLDVGAQMLELRNEELARRWLELELDPRIKAAVYFNDSDELTVVTRDGIVEELNSSPFQKRLDQCLVYLDDAHTRGTDLKLPIPTRAAVTLGRKVTKDRLVQGCMRLRRLGHGQSVLFLAPPDIDRGIRKVAKKGLHTLPDIEDVLHWSMTETWADIEHHASLWAQQGFDHRKRKEVMDNLLANNGYPGINTLVPNVRRAWVQPEAQSLEELYFDPTPRCAFSKDDILKIPEFKDRLELISGGIESPNMGEEQEREVNHEIERERQQERPKLADPAPHQVHDGVRMLVQHGSKFPSTTLLPLFDVLKNTSRYSYLFQWSGHLFATKDFAVTIIPETADHAEYLKPVRWILSVQHESMTKLIVLSQYEANVLLPEIRRSNRVNLHLYCPRVTRDMPTTFDMYSIHPTRRLPLPPRIALSQFHLFAGQLYLTDEEVYAELCDFLGLSREDGDFVNSDGFVPPTSRHRTPAIQQACSFKQSPVPFLRGLIGLRRKGNSYAQTHIGRILGGRVLLARDFESRF